MNPHKKTVVIGMSGGVDSSVSALLLKQQGYNVIGLFMKNWEETDANGVCQSAKDFQDVERVCEQLAIPYYAVNFVQEYRDLVFQSFIDELKLGYTPNPDILCNREIKFNVLLKRALTLGADYLATGHYCQRGLNSLNQTALLKGFDPGKDQSYFLYTLKEQILEQVLFPIGHLHKSEVREIAKRHKLATSEKKDSTGICFIGKRDFKEFVNRYVAYTPGDFETVEGKKLGQHDGVAFYTIGQRKGMGIGGAGEPWFVAGKDVKRNVVYLAQGGHHPALYADSLTATDISWVSTNQSLTLPFRCTAKIRYRQPDQACTIVSIKEGRLEVVFDEPQRAITPRQSIVFYREGECLGGAMIEKAAPSYYHMQKSLPQAFCM